MKLVDEIRLKLETVLQEMGVSGLEFMVEHPAEEKFGDYSSNVAMAIFSKSQFSKSNFQSNSKISKFSNPREIAETIAEKLEGFEKVEVAGQGFINISINIDYFVREIERVLTCGAGYGQGKLWEGKKVAVEYTDPNPFKEFHIGHLYSNIIGESISRLFEANGARVWRGDFYGDVGLHTAKALWGLVRKLQFSNPNFQTNSKNKNSKFKIDWKKWEDLEEKPLAERVKFLGEAYALGVNTYETDEKAKKEIVELNKIIYVVAKEMREKKRGQWEEVKRVYEAGLTWSLEYFETIYKRVGTKFDGYYPESWVGEYGVTLVQKGLKMGILEKSEGAVVYKGEQDGLHTRVFLNKAGLPTYEAKDLGLAYAKYQDFKYDLSLNVFGKEIDEYYKVVLATLKKIEPELGAKGRHLAHGMVNLPEGKMSSRKGNVITAEGLLEEIKERVRQVSKETGDEVIEMVAQGAVKYALLKSGVGRDVTFDLQESVSFEGNSGPYLQYTYARARSVLRRANFQFSIFNFQSISNLQFNNEELTVMRWIARFPEVLEKACREYAPNQVCTYLFELSQRFNSFYNKHSILGKTQNKFSNSNFQFSNKSKIQNPPVESDSTGQAKSKNDQEEQTRNFRLALTAATAQVLKNGLWVLGIGAPEKM